MNPEPATPIDSPLATWLAEAKGLSIAAEVVDTETGYICFRSNGRSLAVLLNPASDQDFVVFGVNTMFGGFFSRDPARVRGALEAVGVSHGLPHVFRIGRVGEGTVRELNRFLRGHMPVVVEDLRRRYRRVIDERRRHIALTELLNTGPSQVTARRHHPVSRQLLVVNGVVADASDYCALHLVGDGHSSVEQLVRQAVLREFDGRPASQLDAIAVHCAGIIESGTPDDGELLGIHNPIPLELQDRRWFSTAPFDELAAVAARVLGAGIAVITAARTIDGVWLLTDIQTRGLFNEFVDYHSEGREAVIGRLLETFFSTEPPRHVLPALDGDEDSDEAGHEPSAQAREYQRAAARLGLDCELLSARSNIVHVAGHDRQLYVHAVRFGELSCNASTAVVYSGSKDNCYRLFRRHGIPAPEYRSFDSPGRHADEALQNAVLAYAAERYPVVVKPARSSRSIGVTLDIHNHEHLRRAVRRACLSRSTRIVVEEYIEADTNPVPGTNYRVSVCRGEVVRIGYRTPLYVTGDGRHTCRELIERENLARYEAGHNLIGMQPGGPTVEQLARAGLTLEDVPRAGRFINLFQALLYVQTRPIELSRFHPDNLAMLGRAATLTGLEWTGLDFITPDPARSYKDVRCAITDVNSRPGVPPNTCSTYIEPLLRAYFIRA